MVLTKMVLVTVVTVVVAQGEQKKLLTGDVSKDPACLVAVVAAGVGSTVLLLVVSGLLYLVRQGRLQLVRNPREQKPVLMSRDTTTQEISPVKLPGDVADQPNRDTYCHAYALLDAEKMTGNINYDVIQKTTSSSM